jgi:DNA recombination protein Rad52
VTDTTIQDRLAAPLDAARVKQRDSGRGASLSYLETHDVIRTANDIFGFGQWGHQVRELRQVGEATVHNRDQKAGMHVGYVCIVELTVAGFVPVSGVGYGDAVEYRESAPVTAHELAVKEAESDALKRALKNYGDQFGLALYDKAAGQNGHLTYGDTADKPAAVSPRTPDTPPADDGEWRWPSGKHQGQTLAETEKGYIRWYAEKGPKPEVQVKCAAYLSGVPAAAGGTFEDESEGLPF